MLNNWISIHKKLASTLSSLHTQKLVQNRWEANIKGQTIKRLLKKKHENLPNIGGFLGRMQKLALWKKNNKFKFYKVKNFSSKDAIKKM